MKKKHYKRRAVKQPADAAHIHENDEESEDSLGALTNSAIDTVIDEIVPYIFFIPVWLRISRDPRATLADSDYKPLLSPTKFLVNAIVIIAVVYTASTCALDACFGIGQDDRLKLTMPMLCAMSEGLVWDGSNYRIYGFEVFSYSWNDILNNMDNTYDYIETEITRAESAQVGIFYVVSRGTIRIPPKYAPKFNLGWLENCLTAKKYFLPLPNGGNTVEEYIYELEIWLKAIPKLKGRVNYYIQQDSLSDRYAGLIFIISVIVAYLICAPLFSFITRCFKSQKGTRSCLSFRVLTYNAVAIGFLPLLASTSAVTFGSELVARTYYGLHYATGVMLLVMIAVASAAIDYIIKSFRRIEDITTIAMRGQSAKHGQIAKSARVGKLVFSVVNVVVIILATAMFWLALKAVAAIYQQLGRFA